MNKIASVIYAYRPKNDDELELNLGDKIEIIGYEEEGWWKGKLKGRIGVFPSNFVQVIETASPSNSSSTTNKLNSIFGSKVSSKNSISSNSLNSINNNSGNNHFNNNNNNNNSSSNSNLLMNNTQSEDSTNDYPFSSADGSSFLTANSAVNDKRPKPIRGNGFGDIFAAGGAKLKPPTVDPSKPAALASERLSTMASNLTNTLQKPVPKKPPPPAPATDSNPNGSPSINDQAPALPPKPSNQLSPFMQPNTKPLPPPVTNPQIATGAQQVREQAKVLFSYKADNPDELTIEVGDIINVLDKNIDDDGWWKGELGGKIGVFPNNFIKLIELPSEDWQGGGSNSNNKMTSANQLSGALGFAQATANTDGKLKSVFASTPDGFTKQLENNLEKHGNPASFLSLKRNKLQQQQQIMSNTITSCDQLGSATMLSEKTNNKHETGSMDRHLNNSTTKLNHITANRAKGPSRRPPSNILNKRNQSIDSPGKGETNGRVMDDFALGSLPVVNPQSQINQESLASLPIGQQQNSAPIVASNRTSFTQDKSDVINPTPPVKSGALPDKILHAHQVLDSLIKHERLQASSVTTQLSPDKVSSSPPWMVELRKSNLGKKREASVSSNQDDDISTTPTTKTIESSTANLSPGDQSSSDANSSPSERKTTVQSLRETYNPPTVSTVKSISSRYSTNESNTSNNVQPTQSGTTDLPRVGLLSGGNSVTNNHSQDTSSTNETSSPITNRMNNQFKGSSANYKNDVASKVISNGNENGGFTANHVPSSISKPPSALSNANPIHSNDTNVHKVSTGQPPIIDKFPQAMSNNKMSALIGQDQPTLDDDSKFIMTKAQYDNLFKQISTNLTSEISELRNEIKELQVEFKGIGELKASLEAMRIELKTCQNATENQKRYIKELVNNLADERKKIASMQGEIERNLK